MDGIGFQLRGTKRVGNFLIWEIKPLRPFYTNGACPASKVQVDAALGGAPFVPYLLRKSRLIGHIRKDVGKLLVSLGSEMFIGTTQFQVKYERRR